MQHAIRYILLSLALCFALLSKGQDIAKLDAKTYQLYYSQQWNRLIELGEDCKKKKIDFYYLDIRMAVAYFQTQKYYTAEELLEQFAQKAPENPLINELLFWIYTYTDRAQEAEELRRKTPAQGQLKQQPYTAKWLTGAYLEGGVKLSNNRDLVDHLLYGHVMLTQNPKWRWNLSHAFTFQTQNRFWGDLRQYEYYFSTAYYLKKGWRLGGAFHGAWGDSQTDYVLPNYGENRLNLIYSGSTNYSYLLGQIDVSRTRKRWTTSLYGMYANSTSDPNERLRILGRGRIPQEQITSGIKSSNQWQFGGGASYQLPFWKDRVGIGADLNIVGNDSSTHLVPVVFASIQPAQKWRLTLRYLNKGNFAFADQKGYLLFNFADKINYRAATSVFYNLNKHWELIGTFSTEELEEATDVNSSVYRMNSAYIGIHFKF